jgi:SAM-dependent methyltransferase
VKLVKESICVFRDAPYGFAMCAACQLKFAHPFSNDGLNYEAVQARHTGYAVHVADNEWIHAMLSRGPESHWTQAAVDFLAEKTMDSRYIHVLQIAVDAAQRNRRLKILEVGCNLGYIGAVLTRLGHNYTGLEIQEKAVAQARSYYGDHYRAEPIEQFAERSGERFDLICSFEVIEHVLRPMVFLQACVSLLAPQGRLVLTTPNGDQMQEEDWLTDFPPIHLTIFKSSTFEKLQPGLKVTLIDDLQHNRPGPHIWGRLKHRFQSETKPASLPVMDPSSPAFVYGPAEQQWSSPYVLHSTDVLRRAVADATSLVLGSPVGYCMIVEVSR